MKILQIISSLAPGGAEIFVKDLSIALKKNGHEISIAYISSSEKSGSSLKFEDIFKQTLGDNGIPFFEIGHECKVNILKGGYQIRKLIREIRPDVVHAHLYFGLIFTIFSTTRTPLIYTHHNIEIGRGKLLFPFFNFFVNRYIGISLLCGKMLAETSHRDATIIYNGINIRHWEPKTYFPTSQVVKIIAVGNLSRQKNHTLLINAISKLKKSSLQPFHLTIVGDGSLRPILLKQIDELDLQENVFLPGVYTDMKSCLHDADIFVLSSMYEGLPISLLEAIATGLPCIVPNTGGCQEIVDKCRCGLVIRVNDIDALENALLKLLNDRDLRINLGKNAIDNRDKFSIDVVANEYLDVYQSVVYN